MTTKKMRARSRAAIWIALALACFGVAGRAWGEGAPREVSAGAYAAELGRLQGLVAACEKTAAACDGKAVGGPVNVRVEGTAYTVRWEWLAAALDKARAAADAKDGRKEKLADAREGLAAAAVRLSEDAAAAAGQAQSEPLPNAGHARQRADAVLAGKEFRLVQGQSYLAQKLAAFFLFLDEVFSRLGGLLPHSPAIGQALEWGVLGLAAAGLLLWAWRVNQRGKLELVARVDAGERVWREEAEKWAERAEAEAGRGDWREAVHSLYWSAIVMGEGQGLWRQNRARTPREYVRLLEPGTARQTSLRKLTGVFERIWYGLRPAAEADFRQAKAWLDELRAG